MKNELFTIGPFTVYSYGFMIAVGVFAAWLTAEYRAKNTVQIQTRYFFWCCGVWWEDFWAPSFCSGSQNGKRLQQIRVLFKDNDRRICCLWRNYRRNYRRLAVQQDNKTEFPEIF